MGCRSQHRLVLCHGDHLFCPQSNCLRWVGRVRKEDGGPVHLHRYDLAGSSPLHQAIQCRPCHYSPSVKLTESMPGKATRGWGEVQRKGKPTFAYLYPCCKCFERCKSGHGRGEGIDTDDFDSRDVDGCLGAMLSGMNMVEKKVEVSCSR